MKEPYPYQTTGQCGYAQQGQQNAANYPDAPPVPSRLSSIAGHIESLNGEFNTAIERLVRLADRLNGAQPQEGKPEGSLRGSPGGLTAVIENHLEHSNTLVNRLRNVLERLETL